MELAAWAGALVEPTGARRRPDWTYRRLWAEVAGALGGATWGREIGRSVEGEPIWAVTVAHEGATRPGVLVIANLHAMEHVGARTAVTLLRRAAAGEGGWRGRRLTVVPLANPDGFRAVERAMAERGRRYHRANAHGVDLNRNFGVGWNPANWLLRVLPGVFSPGPAPLSEPETQALDALAAEERPSFFVSLHAFGEWIYLPWAGRRDLAPDHEALAQVGAEMARRQPRPYRVVALGRRSRLFKAPGAEIDHFYERHGALSFLIEIGSGPRLSRPASWLDAYRWYNAHPDRLDADVANVQPALDYLAEASWQRER